MSIIPSFICKPTFVSNQLIRKMSSDHILKTLFFNAVEAVKPKSLFRHNEQFRIEFEKYIKDDKKRKYHVIGFGKAVLGMAVEIESILTKKLTSGIISIPIGTLDKFKDVVELQLPKDSKIQIIECAKNNLPDKAAEQAAKKINMKAQSMSSDDILFVLISGGGSALLPLPKEPISLEEKVNLIQALARKGATINEINIVRMRLSDVKGGKLAQSAKKAHKTISLIISDIVNDPLELIASGPTIHCSVTNENAIFVLKKYEIYHEIPASIKLILNDGLADHIEPVNNSIVHVIGNNGVAINNILHDKSDNMASFFLSSKIQGNVQALGVAYARLAFVLKQLMLGKCEAHDFSYEMKELDVILNGSTELSVWILKSLNVIKKDLLIVAGGEPTVTVSGKGLGGRNQELALRFSIEAKKYEHVLKDVRLLSAGTDGIDGPTIAAGALGGVQIIDDYYGQQTNHVQSFVENNDSFNFYKNLSNGKYHIITGHTATNVMDLHLLYIPK